MVDDVDPFGGAQTLGDTSPAVSSSPKDGEQKPSTIYGSAEEFLHDWLLPCYVRDVGGKRQTWCPRWFMHPEAVSRITAIWLAWENLRLEGATGMSVYWINHADPNMRMLMSLDGPFYNCIGGHRPPPPIPYELAPTGWFPDTRLDHSE